MKILMASVSNKNCLQCDLFFLVTHKQGNLGSRANRCPHELMRAHTNAEHCRNTTSNSGRISFCALSGEIL